MSAPFPIILDSCPPFLGGADPCASLLQVPCGHGTLLDELMASLAGVTSRRPLVLPAFRTSDDYAHRIVDAFPQVGGVLRSDILSDPLARFDPADRLLFVSPSMYPVDGLDVDALVPQRGADVLMARHLVLFEQSNLGTKEFVQSGPDGRVRRIQRYFEATSWPFTAGVAASLIPVSSLLSVPNLSGWSLDDLRRELAGKGVPAQDIPYRTQVFDLGDENGVLALHESRVIAVAARRVDGPGGEARSVVVSEGARVHPTARLLGAVVVKNDATIGERALVVGPTLIGEGAVVGHDAVVAQCLVLPNAVVGERASIRHRVVADTGSAETNGVQHHTPPHRRHRYVAQPTAEREPNESRYLRIKAIVEPMVALAALLALSPLLAVIALLIKLTSRGPVFYGDRREGKGGKEFKCWKFRSMLVDADAMQITLASEQYVDGPQFKMVDDPRLTRIGAKLRALNLDEVPQLLNVLKGEMSFVGPRPSPFRENQICVPWRQGRLSVRPGITGLWQVCRKDRAQGDFHQWIYYDLTYVRHVSLLVDLKIFLSTISTLGGRFPVRLESIIPDAAPLDQSAAEEWVPSAPPKLYASRSSIPLATRAHGTRRVGLQDAG